MPLSNVFLCTYPTPRLKYHDRTRKIIAWLFFKKKIYFVEFQLCKITHLVKLQSSFWALRMDAQRQSLTEAYAWLYWCLHTHAMTCTGSSNHSSGCTSNFHYEKIFLPELGKWSRQFWNYPESLQISGSFTFYYREIKIPKYSVPAWHSNGTNEWVFFNEWGRALNQCLKVSCDSLRLGVFDTYID